MQCLQRLFRRPSFRLPPPEVSRRAHPTSRVGVQAKASGPVELDETATFPFLTVCLDALSPTTHRLESGGVCHDSTGRIPGRTFAVGGSCRATENAGEGL